MLLLRDSYLNNEIDVEIRAGGIFHIPAMDHRIGWMNIPKIKKQKWIQKQQTVHQLQLLT